VRTLGTVKHKHWEFEREVRYRIFATFGYATDEFDHDWMTPDELVKSPVITEYVDIPLDPSVLEEISVVLGPKTTDSERRAVEDICTRYAPKTTVERSMIPIR
jgi:hypothetical protein